MKTNSPFVSAVIPCAGRGTRMQQSINKNLLLLAGKPLIIHSLQRFCEVKEVQEILLIIKDEDKKTIESILNQYPLSKNIRLVYGAGTRQGSVYNGLRNLNPDCDIVSIHDGARPLITREIILSTIDAALKYGACCAAMDVKETIAVQDNGKISSLLVRDTLASIQTPQTFQKELICQAHEKALLSGFQTTDDTSLVRQFGHDVHLVKGSDTNIKVTTPRDLLLAEHLLMEKTHRRQIHADK